MPIVRGTIASTLAPGLNFYTFTRFKEKPEKYRQIVNVKDSKLAYEVATGMTGLGPLSPKSELDAPAVDVPLPLGEAKWIHDTFALAIILSKEARDDERYQAFTNMAGMLGRSARYTAEVFGHDVYNQGFSSATYTGMDGKALFAVDHPIGDSGTVVANRPPVNVVLTLSISALEAAVQAFETQVDDRGIPAESMPQNVLVHPQNRMLLKRLLQTSNYPTSNLNDINPINDENLKPISSPYFTDPDMFIVTGATSELGVVFYWREMTDTATWDDPGTDAVFHKVRQRHSVGFDEWRHTWGSPGT